MIKIFKSEKGYTLMTALLTVALTVVFAATLIGLLTNELSSLNRSKSAAEAYYLARKGIVAAVNDINQNPTDSNRGNLSVTEDKNKSYRTIYNSTSKVLRSIGAVRTRGFGAPRFLTEEISVKSSNELETYKFEESFNSNNYKDSNSSLTDAEWGNGKLQAKKGLAKIYDSPVDITDIQFIDDKVGYYLYDNQYGWSQPGVIYKTTDGGFTWSQAITVDATEKFKPVKVHFFNKNTGYLCGSTRNSTWSRAAIYATSNGGNTWSIVYQHSLSDGARYPTGYATWFYDMSFPSANVGYAVGRKVDIPFWGGSRVEPMAYKGNYGYWNKINGPSYPSGSGSNEEKHYPHVSFIDENHGYISYFSQYYNTYGGGWQSQVGYGSTSNGGSSWSASTAVQTGGPWSGIRIDEMQRNAYINNGYAFYFNQPWSAITYRSGLSDMNWESADIAYFVSADGSLMLKKPEWWWEARVLDQASTGLNHVTSSPTSEKAWASGNKQIWSYPLSKDSKAQSLSVGVTNKPIREVKIVIDRADRPLVGNLDFEVSAKSGQTGSWRNVSLDNIVEIPIADRGSDLKWKVNIRPNRGQAPIVNHLTIYYTIGNEFEIDYSTWRTS